MPKFTSALHPLQEFREKSEPTTHVRAYVGGMGNEAEVRLALIQTEGNLTWAASRFAVSRTNFRKREQEVVLF